MTSILRRYTPPTCTLEIAAKDSPLSRWTDRPVLQRLRFNLNFDDPKLPPDRQVRIRGDRVQLEALWEAVSDYVQQFLILPAPAMVSDRALPSVLPGLEETAINGASKLNTSREIGTDTRLQASSVRGRDGAVATPNPAKPAGIKLQPGGLVSHELHLGTLATEESGAVVRLSAVQLFDLANALDEYASDVVALPDLNRSTWVHRKSWLSIAAVALVSFGVTATLIKFVSDMNAPVETATTAVQSSTDQAPSSAPQTVPATPLPSNLPSGKLTTPPNPIPLPPPPPTGTTLPPARSGAAIAPPTPNRRNSPPRGMQPLPSIAVAPSEGRTLTQIPTQPTAEVPAGRLPAATSAPSADANAAAARNSPAANRIARPSSSAFDTIPQVAEARSYFEQRWQPPEALTQTLEYQLDISPDGTIARIVPLGQAAGSYVDRTQIPLVGEPFVSAIPLGKTAKIRLVLSPDGRVRTFLESLN